MFLFKYMNYINFSLLKFISKRRNLNFKNSLAYTLLITSQGKNCYIQLFSSIYNKLSGLLSQFYRVK